MQRVLDECTEMGVRLRDDDGPNAELRCWRQRVAMLSTIEKQLETHECQLVSRAIVAGDLGCILPRAPAIIVRTGRLRSDSEPVGRGWELPSDER